MMNLEPPVLVVGAGGIGCELLKNLVLSGFTNIHVIDLDVIELSNLNRQFLFRRQHIGQPKCKVAAEAVMALRPSASVTAHWANVKDTDAFPLSFFRGFRIVLNALDNIDARRHVNNMCLSAGVPLVESGTAGYLGQSSVIIPGQSECFDCVPKETPKVYPVCTIRATPSVPIHCIVWAKEFLLANLFGEPAEEAYLEGTDGLPTTDSCRGHLIVVESVMASLKRETEAFAVLRQEATDNDPAYAQHVFNKVFRDDIASLLDLKDLWNSGRTPPVPMEVDLEEVGSIDGSTARDHHAVWAIEEWVSLFRSSLERLRDRAFASTFVPMYFDKDDDDTMDFVAATANIRAFIFSIPLSSRFSLKSMAGNIIPAIATTNAIVAGTIVLQAKNVLEGHTEKCSTAFVTYGMRRGTLFAKEALSEPNRNCAVCHVDRAIARLDPGVISLETFLDSILAPYSIKLGIQLSSDHVTVLEGSRILYDEDMTENAGKTLEELGCVDSKFIKLDFVSTDIPLVVAVDGRSAREGNANLGLEFAMMPPHRRQREKIESASDREANRDLMGRQEELDALEPPRKLAKTSVVLDEDDLDVVLL